MKDFTMMNQTECIDALNKEITNLKEDQILDRAIIDKLRKDNEKLTSIIARVTDQLMAQSDLWHYICKSD